MSAFAGFLEGYNRSKRKRESPLSKMAEQFLADKPDKSEVMKIMREIGYELNTAKPVTGTNILNHTELSYYDSKHNLMMVFFINDKFNNLFYINLSY